jgi:hypothetical protein
MAFILLSCVFSQWLVVIFSAVSACFLIVFDKKLNLGRWDWRLLLGTFCLAIVCAGIAYGLGLLGPSGAWSVFYAESATTGNTTILQIYPSGHCSTSRATNWKSVKV